jgi:hypothetical protein
MKIDKSIIKELSDYLEEFNLTEIEITEKDTKIKVSKNNVSISNQRETSETESTNNGYKFGQEEETYNIVAAHGYFGRLIFQLACGH